jgi:hypothetical protein
MNKMKVSQLTNLIKEALDSAPVDGTRSGNIESLKNSKYTLTSDVKGARIGDRIVTLPTGTVLYNKPGGLFADIEGKMLMVKQEPKTLQSIEDNSGSLDEIDNSDLAMKVRAAKIRAAQAKNPDTKFAVGRENNLQRDAKIKDLNVRRAQVMRDMEQEAEPEGGPIADKYGSELNQIDQAIRKLKGIKNENYDDRNLEEAQDSNNKGYIVARDLIAKLRATTFRKFNDDELEEFRKTIADAFDMSLKEEWSKGRQAQLGLGPQSGIFTKGQNVNDPIDLSETKEDLERIAQSLESQFEDLKFDVNDQSDRIDVRGSQQDLSDFGSKLHSKKFGKYEVFATDDDDRGEIVRIVKSDSISKGGVDEMQVVNKKTNKDITKHLLDYMEGKIDKNTFEKLTGLKKESVEEKKSNPSMGIVRKKLGKVPKASKVASKKKMKLPTGLVSYMDYSVSEKKDDRCTRIAKRKYDTWPSAYASGAVVRCRKGEIWKGIK